MNEALKAKIFALNTSLMLHNGVDHTSTIHAIRKALADDAAHLSDYEKTLVETFYAQAIRHRYSLMCQDYTASATTYRSGYQTMSHAFAYRFQGPSGEGYKQELTAMLEEAKLTAKDPLKKSIATTLAQYSEECHGYHSKNLSGADLPELMPKASLSASSSSSTSAAPRQTTSAAKRKWDDDTQVTTQKAFAALERYAKKSVDIDPKSEAQLKRQDETVYRLFTSRNHLLQQAKNSKATLALKKNDEYFQRLQADSHYNFALTRADQRPLSQQNLVEARDHLELASDIYRFALNDVDSADITDSTIGEMETKRMRLAKRQKLASSSTKSDDVQESVKYKKR